MNNLRKKIVSAAVAASLLGGSLVAFAGTDAGEQLKAWYNAQFTQSTNSIVSTLTNYFNTTYKQNLLSWFNSLKSSSVSAITNHASTTLTNSTNTINNYANTYIGQINTAKQNILDNMATDYSKFEEGKKTWGTAEMNKEQEKRQGEINTAVTNEFNTQKTSLENSLNTTKESAVSSLESAIKNAKDAIIAEIATNEATTTTNLKNFLDTQISTRKTQMETTSQELVNAKMVAITEAANDIVDAAKAELDALIQGINK